MISSGAILIKLLSQGFFKKGIPQLLLGLSITINQIEYASKNSLKLVQFPFSNPTVVAHAEN